MRIGVLALQGGFAAHVTALRALGHDATLVRDARDLGGLAGLVLPGGESTVQLQLMDRLALAPALDAFVRAGRPVLATCAGLILAARHVTRPAQRSLGWLDVSVARNAWGRRHDCFEARADGTGLPLTFIRAPRIVEVGAGVEILERLGGEPILVKQGAVHGATFHPELTADRRVHRAIFGAGAAAAA